MRRFKHKPTGIFVTQDNHAPIWYRRDDHNPGYIIENFIVENGSDWEEIQERKPVVTLQGKDLFNGDSYWFVDKKFNRSHVVLGEQPYYNNPFLVYFSTFELAEQYIIDNKPVYPAGPVDQVVRLYNLYKEFPNVDKAVEDAIQQLKKFKQ